MHGRVHSFGVCPTCGKHRWTSKAAAKAAIRQHARPRKGQHVYKCGDYWHFGRLPAAVVAGDLDRHDLAPRRPA